MAEDCLYVKKLTTSTIVTHSAICNFTSVSDKNLVLAKNNCLQIHKIENGDGKLSNLFDVPINGNIIFLATYRPLSTSKHYIFFVTEKYQYVSISFNAQSSKISTHFVNNINDFWGDPIGAKIQGDVESSKSLAALNFYKSKIKIIDIFPEERNNRAFDSLMDNNVIASIQFLHNRKTTLIAVLYNPTNFSKHKNDSYIKIYKVDIDNFELKFEGKEIKVPLTSSLLKSLCKPIEGILVISNSKISFLNNEGQFMANISFSPANILATCPLYENNSVLLSDDIGAIINVTFIKNNKRKIAKLNAKKIGFANIAHCLSKIGPRTFFIGSICDDSQIVRINDNLNIGKNVKTLKTFSNVGPIKDIELIRKAKIENDHQKILFCTGHKTFGQIGILEKSLEMTKVSELNIRKCIDIFVFGPFVLLTFYEKTRIFKFSENSLQEIETPKWLNFDRTIKFEKIDDNLIQITENSINLIEFSPNLANLDSENLARVLITHKTQHKTTQSAIKHDKILILNDKNQILLLNLNRKNMTFSQIAFFSETEKQVSSFSIAYDLSIKTFFVVIGYFDSTQNCVQIQNFAHSKLVKIPINLKLVFPNFVVSADSHFDGGKLIIAFGLNDGNCVFGYMDYKFDFNILCKIKLGQFPVKISATKYLQRRVLLASSEETICFDVEKKDYFYISSSENLDKGYSHSYKNLINTKNYLFLKNDKLLIGEINFDDEPNKYSVFKRKFNDFAPMKISFCQKTKKICVAGTTAKRSKNEPILLLFNLDFSLLNKFDFYRDEQRIVDLVYTKPFFVAATSKLNNSENFGLKNKNFGFLHVLKCVSKRLVLKYEKKLDGSIWSICSKREHVFVGVDNYVAMYKFDRDKISEKIYLKMVTKFNCHVLTLKVKNLNNLIISGDIMRSITLLGHDTETLHKLASDCRMSFVTDTEFLDKDNFVTADRHGNLRYIKRDVDSSKRLLPDLATKGRFHLGSKITIMDRTSADFNPIEDHNRKRIIFFGTAEGEFGVVFKVDSDDLSKIKKLQNVLSNNYSNFHSLLKHMRYREFFDRTNEKVQMENFLDGNLLNIFEDLDKNSQKDVALKSDCPLKDIFRTLKQLDDEFSVNN